VRTPDGRICQAGHGTQHYGIFLKYRLRLKTLDRVVLGDNVKKRALWPSQLGCCEDPVSIRGVLFQSSSIPRGTPKLPAPYTNAQLPRVSAVVNGDGNATGDDLPRDRRTVAECQHHCTANGRQIIDIGEGIHSCGVQGAGLDDIVFDDALLHNPSGGVTFGTQLGAISQFHYELLPGLRIVESVPLLCPKKPDPTTRCLSPAYFPEYNFQARKAFEAVTVKGL